MSDRYERAGSIEPAITRLQIELALPRRLAEACVRAGFRVGAEIAAADDRDFHARVALPETDRLAVLDKARAPGSHPVTAGERPVLSSERNPAGRVLALAKPVTDRIAKLGAPTEPAPPPRTVPKVEPPHGEADARRRHRKEADDIEAELDERLRGG